MTSFTGPVMTKIVDWTLSGRGGSAGILVTENYGEEARVGPPCREGAALGLAVVSNEEIREVGAHASEKIDHSAWIGRLTGPEGYHAVCLTGHGAEHCIAAGLGWLSLHSGYGLDGVHLDPRDWCTNVVFLNGCSTLKLADSLVPEHLLVAMSLYRSGVAVIGPYRNVRVPKLLESCFVKCVSQGLSAGEVATELNRALEGAGEVPCVVVLGDPDIPVGPSTARPGAKPTPQGDVQRQAALKQLETAAGDLASARSLVHDLRLWRWAVGDGIDALGEAEALLQSAGAALAFETQCPLEKCLLETLAGALSRLRDALLKQLAGQIAEWIRGGRWVQAAYAPLAPARIVVDRPCGPSDWCALGEGRLVEYEYEGPALGNRKVRVRECDRCGSCADWTGTGDVGGPLRLEITQTAVGATVPPLGAGEQGLIFLHRCAAVDPVEWPRRGGRIGLDLSASQVHGRITVVALRLSSEGLALSYGHAFRDPETGMMRQGGPPWQTR